MASETKVGVLAPTMFAGITVGKGLVKASENEGASPLLAAIGMAMQAALSQQVPRYPEYHPMLM